MKRAAVGHEIAKASLAAIRSSEGGEEAGTTGLTSRMFNNEDLKLLASRATELNQLIQQVSRHTDQLRQHQGEMSYLALLTERVELASRRSQELFELITSRILNPAGILTAAGALPFAAPDSRSPGPLTAPRQGGLTLDVPMREVDWDDGLVEEEDILNPEGKLELLLLVDDNEDILDGTSAILAFEGYRVVLAKDGPEALRIYWKLGSRISLVILDYFLPVMDGDTVFDELKALNPGVRVVLSSGFAEQVKLNKMLNRGLCGFIPKPYTRDKLINQIRTILDS